VNGDVVAQVSDADYASGETGFYVETLDETLAHIHYDVLTIRELEAEAIVAAPTETPEPTAAATETPTSEPEPTEPAEPAATAVSDTLPTQEPTPEPSPTPSPTPTEEVLPTCLRRRPPPLRRRLPGWC
jgi:outer membrane biosynthesis protein TonB